MLYKAEEDRFLYFYMLGGGADKEFVTVQVIDLMINK